MLLKTLSFVIFAAVVLAPQRAHAQFSSIASSPENYSWITASTQSKADRAVLEHCNQERRKKDCKLAHIKALAQALGVERWGFASSNVSLADAKTRALKSCAAPSCKIKFVDTDPGFYVFVTGRAEQEEHDGYSKIWSGRADLEALEQRAVAECEAAGFRCTIFDFGVIPGRHIRGSVPALQTSERSCRPTTPTIRCTSNCVNGDCVVKYENGCKMRIQVQSRYDSFSRRWTYPAPSC